MKRTFFQLLSVATLALGATGCSVFGDTKYACPAPEGVVCMSTLEVYRATENADRVEAVPREVAAESAKSGSSYRGSAYTPGPAAAKGAEQIDVIDGALTLQSGPRGNQYPAVPAPDVLPVRTPAKVMRIWVAPWTDADGDLHVGGVLFTEITPRKWSIGRPALEGSGSFRLITPLEGDDGAGLSPGTTSKPEAAG